MNESTTRQAPKYLTVIALVAVVWNLLGVLAFVFDVTMTDEARTALPAAQQALHEARPGWVLAVFGVAVFAGLAGSVALLLKRSVATIVLSVSLLAILAQNFWAFLLANTIAAMGPASIVLPVVVILIGAGLVWLSLMANGKGWLR